MISFIFLFFSTFAAELNCQIYDLATAQVLAEKSLQLKLDSESSLRLEAIGVQAVVWDRPLQNNDRVQSLEINNGLGQAENTIFIYNISDIGKSPEKFLHVTSEIPGLGDTVQFYCR